MSDVSSTLSLILGIIGTLTGSIAVFIHWWRLRIEQPRLDTSVLKCEHAFGVSESGVKTIAFWTNFRIKNRGDRGTGIFDVDLDFEDNEQKHHLRKQYFRDRPVEEEGVWISPHDVLNLTTDFWQTYQGNEKEKIDIHLTIHHTHGAENVKAVSQKRKERERT